MSARKWPARKADILGCEFTVKRVAVSKMPKDIHGNPLHGYCDMETCEIWLLKSLGLEATWEAFKHEVSHACGHQCGSRTRLYELLGDKADQMEEDIVSTWIPVTLDVLKRLCK